MWHFLSLHQDVVSKEILPPYSLYMPHPRSLLIFSNESLAQYSDALIIVEVEEPMIRRFLICFQMQQQVYMSGTNAMTALCMFIECDRWYIEVYLLHINLWEPFTRHTVARTLGLYSPTLVAHGLPSNCGIFFSKTGRLLIELYNFISHEL